MDPGQYEAAARDAGLRARLQTAFEAAGGCGSVVDELWWRERPGLPHPGGAADPAAGRAALVEAAYSKATSEQDATASAAELREFESHRRRQRDALDAALALTGASASRPPVAPSDADSPSSPSSPDSRGSRGSRDQADPLRPAPAAPARTPGFAARHRVAVAVTALALAVVVGALGSAAASRITTALAPTPTPTATPAVTVSVLSVALARVQVPTDALPTALREGVDARSSRLLYDDEPSDSGTESRWRLWITAGENPRQLCFVASFDNVTDAQSCVPRETALSDRVVLSTRSGGGSFEMLAVTGAVAVQID